MRAAVAALAIAVAACGGLVVDGPVDEAAGQTQRYYATSGPGSHGIALGGVQADIDATGFDGADWPGGHGVGIPVKGPFGSNEGPGSNSLDD